MLVGGGGELVVVMVVVTRMVKLLADGEGCGVIGGDYVIFFQQFKYKAL